MSGHHEKILYIKMGHMPLSLRKGHIFELTDYRVRLVGEWVGCRHNV